MWITLANGRSFHVNRLLNDFMSHWHITDTLGTTLVVPELVVKRYIQQHQYDAVKIHFLMS